MYTQITHELWTTVLRHRGKHYKIMVSKMLTWTYNSVYDLPRSPSFHLPEYHNPKCPEKKKNDPEKMWPTQSTPAELASITVAKRACDWATEVTWTVSYTARAMIEVKSYFVSQSQRAPYCNKQARRFEAFVTLFPCNYPQAPCYVRHNESGVKPLFACLFRVPARPS